MKEKTLIYMLKLYSELFMTTEDTIPVFQDSRESELSQKSTDEYQHVDRNREKMRTRKTKKEKKISTPFV